MRGSWASTRGEKLFFCLKAITACIPPSFGDAVIGLDLIFDIRVIQKRSPVPAWVAASYDAKTAAAWWGQTWSLSGRRR